MEASIEERLARIERLILIGTKNALNTAEAALMLGITESRVRHLVCEKSIPHYKQNGHTYFDKREVERWLLKRRVPTAEETASEAATYIALKKMK